MQNSITEEKRDMRVTTSLTYYPEGMELKDLTHGKEPHFFSIQLGTLSVYVDLENTEAFVKEMSEICADMLAIKIK